MRNRTLTAFAAVALAVEVADSRVWVVDRYERWMSLLQNSARLGRGQTPALRSSCRAGVCPRPLPTTVAQNPDSEELCRRLTWHRP